MVKPAQPACASSELRFDNEFASVVVRLETFGNGTRLLLLDVKTGRWIALDPLQVESLIWAGDEVLSRFVDPIFRWSDEDSTDSIEVTQP